MLERPGTGLKSGLALGAVAGHEPADPSLAGPVQTGDFGLALTGQHGGDDKATFRHASA